MEVVITKYNELLEKIEQSPARGAWARGVRDYAYMVVESFMEGHGISMGAEVAITERGALRGAKNWEAYSRGGFGLTYNHAICRALCPPYLQKRFEDGQRDPSDKEDWCDVEARALHQAWDLVKRLKSGD